MAFIWSLALYKFVVRLCLFYKNNVRLYTPLQHNRAHSMITLAPTEKNVFQHLYNTRSRREHVWTYIVFFFFLHLHFEWMLVCICAKPIRTTFIQHTTTHSTHKSHTQHRFRTSAVYSASSSLMRDARANIKHIVPSLNTVNRASRKL